MDKRVFYKLIEDNLCRIIEDEKKYLMETYPEFNIISKFEYEPEAQKKELYYLYDKHKVHFKEHIGNVAVDLDRHKLATVFLMVVLEFSPIVYAKMNRKLDYPTELILTNTRIAFRFACAYASMALFSSFVFKKDELEDKIADPKQSKDIEKNIKDKLMYEKAIQQLKEKGGLDFPSTRAGLDKYVDNYLKVIYRQYSYGGGIPYTLIADTFYWIDCYNKLRLGVKVEPEEYKNGLNRYDPNILEDQKLNINN